MEKICSYIILLFFYIRIQIEIKIYMETYFKYILLYEKLRESLKN